MKLEEDLKWANTFGPLQSDPPNGDALALLTLAAAVRRLQRQHDASHAEVMRLAEELRKYSPPGHALRATPLTEAEVLAMGFERHVTQERFDKYTAGLVRLYQQPFDGPQWRNE